MSTDVEKEAALTEYVALRAEILVLIQARNQFWTYDLAGFGTLFTLAVQQHNRTFFLIAPLIHYPMVMYWSYTNAQILKIGLYIKDRLALYLPSIAWERTVFEERLEVLRCYIFPPFSRYLPIRRHLDNEIAAVLTFAGTTALALVLWLAGVSTSEERPGLAIIIILWLLDLTLILYSYYLVRKGSRNLLPYI